MSPHREKPFYLFIQRHVGLSLALLVIAMTLPQIIVGGYAGNCLVNYLQQDRRAQDARDYWSDQIEPLRGESERIELRIYSQTATQEDYHRKREVLLDLRALRRERAKAIEEHPPPEFPRTLCGLIDIS